MQDEEGEIVNFDFVKGIGQNICPLNLFGNEEPSGKNIHAVCKQGPIYVRAKKKLKLWELPQVSESEDIANDISDIGNLFEVIEDEISTQTRSVTRSSRQRQSAGTNGLSQSILSFTNQVSSPVPGVSTRGGSGTSSELGQSVGVREETKAVSFQSINHSH